MELQQKIINALKKVIDPETGLDVIRMELIRNLKVEKDGYISLTFRPSSPVCPLAFQLGLAIQQVVRSVSGVKDLKMDVDGFIYAKKLKKVLAEPEE